MDAGPFSRQQKGRRGEAVAAEFLQRRGFRIVGRNVRIHPYEVDIIAEKGGVVHFVEVKTSASPIPPEANFTPAKEAALAEAVEAYLRQHPETAQVSVDLVTVILRAGRPPLIRHYVGVLR